MELFKDFSEKNNPCLGIGFPPSTLQFLKIDRWRQKVHVHAIPAVKAPAWRAA